MKPQLAPGVYVSKSKIEGKGCFATIRFNKGRKIGEYKGERIPASEVARRVQGRRIYICGVDSYWAIDGSKGGNGTQFINHSCAPNSFVRVTSGHIIFFALRDIEAGEEITLDYVDSYHSDRTSCRCQASNCRSTINKPKTRSPRRKRIRLPSALL